MRNLIIFGASRGLGAALAEGLADPGDEVWCVSRTRPAIVSQADGVKRSWIEHDLSDAARFDKVTTAVGSRALDLLVYNAGIWEQGPFAQTSDAEIRAIVDTNLTSLLLAARHLLANLRRGGSARVVLIGSTCGLENEGTTSVAYAATKFAMRGAAHALRELLRPDGIPVTVISPGSMATDIPLASGREKALEVHGGKRIPVADVVDLVRLITRLSPAACLKEIDLPATADVDA